MPVRALRWGVFVLAVVSTVTAQSWRAPAHAATATPAAAQLTGSLTAVAPSRILDTRSATGGHHAPLGGGQTMTLPVLGGGGVPAAGVSAVLVNVTTTNATSLSSYLTLHQTGTTRPATSTINFRQGVNVANQALVRVGTDGTISIFNAGGDVDVILDIEGWVGVDDATLDARISTASPSRILDTRTTIGGHDAPFSVNETATLSVLGAGDIPSSGVAAIIANVTVVPVAGASGYITAYPDGVARPTASTVNFGPGVITANAAVLQIGPDGGIDIYNASSGANVIVDVVGWIAAGDATTDSGIEGMTPARALDTRSTLGGHPGPVAAGETVRVPVLGVGDVPSGGVAAVVAHVVAVDATGAGYLTVFPWGYNRPSASTLNFPAGTVVGNTITVPVGPDGAIAVYNVGTNPNVVVDIEGWIAAPDLTSVTPPLSSALDAGRLTGTDAGLATQMLTNANVYAMTTWWSSVAPTLMSTPLTATQSSNDAARRLAMEAYSLATSIATGTYDPTATGVPTSVAEQRTVLLIERLASTHVTNEAGGWGLNGQTTMWSAYAGTAAWLLWPVLPTHTQAQIERMIAGEADWAAGWGAHYLRTPSGTVLTPGDTWAEEDSWTMMPVQLALVMFPSSLPHVPVWRYTLVQFSLAAWSRPSDVANATVVNGAPISAWIGGSNVETNGEIVNHDRIAPDYSTNYYQSVEDDLLGGLSGQPVPQAATDLLAPVYAAFRSVDYPAPTYDSPGGTVYLTNSSGIYYPQGCDWGIGQEIPYALADADSIAFGFGTSSSEAYWTLHAKAQLALQDAHTDRHTYDTDTQYKYVGREEHVAQQAAQIFLAYWVSGHGLVATTNDSYWIPAT